MGEESRDSDGNDDSKSYDDDDSPAFCRSALELDRVYESLAHVRRRYLCYLLSDRSELQVDDAVDAIAKWETGSDAGAPTPTRDRIHLSLLHCHIPKLRQNGVVDFDRHSGTLVPDENADAVMAALEAVGTRLCSEQSSAEEGEAA